MVSGVSVGSINATVLAENADDFPAALDKLESIWSEIHCQRIYKATNLALGKSVLRNLSNFIIKQHQSGHLLDTTPLKAMLEEGIDFSKIEQNINAGLLDTFEILSHCYEMHQTISFYNHKEPNFEDWNYPKHSSQRVIIGPEHILASSALPLFFPPVPIKGFHFGDGSVGLVAPLRGAIRFQVERVMILGTRKIPGFVSPNVAPQDEIVFGSILGSMMNSVFMDNLDRDIEMVNRMNEIATLLSMWKKRRSPWRPIKTLHLRPSLDTALIAQSHFNTMPALLRYLLNLLGATKHSGDLLSFLLFEKEFTRELLDMGFKDTIASAKEVTEFFS
jgi:NTE family protein